MRPVAHQAWIFTSALLALACESRSRLPRDLAPRLDLLEAAAQRDSLFQELAETGRVVAEIGRELARFERPERGGTPESPDLQITLSDREVVLARVREVATRLEEAESRLAASQRRAWRLAQQRDSLGGELARAAALIADLQRTAEIQKEALAGLAAQLDDLSAANLALADSVSSLTNDRNTAYYVAGSRRELLARGVLVQDGGRSFPLVGRRRVRPASSPPLGEFTSIDRSRIREIQLPDSTRTYRIVTPQNLASLAEPVSRNGRVRGRIRIASEREFWEPSRYLIAVEEGRR